MNKSTFLNFIKQNKKLIISLFIIIIIIIIILTLYFYYRETFISEGFFQENTLPTTTTITINPPEAKRTYSSTFDTNPEHINSALDSSSAWISRHLNTSQWMTIDLDNIRNVAGVITQGRVNVGQYVTSYKVSVSKDNINYFYVTTSGTSGTETDPERARIFTGNTDSNTKVEHRFNFLIQARYVRYDVVTFNGHISMRAAVIVSTTPPPPPPAPTASQAPPAPTATTAPRAPTAPPAPTATTAPRAPTAPTAPQAPTATTAPRAPTAPPAPTASSGMTLTEINRQRILAYQQLFEENENKLNEETKEQLKLNKTRITYPEITILKEALKENDNELDLVRYDSLNKQDKISNLTKRLNDINYSISTIKQNSKYKASGELTFY